MTTSASAPAPIRTLLTRLVPRELERSRRDRLEAPLGHRAAELFEAIGEDALGVGQEAAATGMPVAALDASARSTLVAAYAAKSALLSLMRSAAREDRDNGIRVNAVLAGARSRRRCSARTPMSSCSGTRRSADAPHAAKRAWLIEG
jgi:NAD(P)-dependent dehydrogenase (short-subunit alcohol dehydrogenase family)